MKMIPYGKPDIGYDNSNFLHKCFLESIKESERRKNLGNLIDWVDFERRKVKDWKITQM